MKECKIVTIELVMSPRQDLLKERKFKEAGFDPEKTSFLF